MKKLGKHLWQGLFCENWGITGLSSLEVKSNTDTAKHLTKVLTVALKDKKSSHSNMKESLHFKQLCLNYIKCQGKALKISNRLYWDRFGTQKSMMRFKYVLSIIQIYNYFSFVFSIVSKKVMLLKGSKKNDEAAVKSLPPCKVCREDEN